jgi:hypothetical protein
MRSPSLLPKLARAFSFKGYSLLLKLPDYKPEVEAKERVEEERAKTE